MHFTALVLAVLPALALADANPAPASTSCTKLVKTVMLSHAHSHTSSLAPTTTTTTTPMMTTSSIISSANGTVTMSRNTTSCMPTGGMTSIMTSTFTLPDATGPAHVPTNSKGPDNAAGALDATNVAFAGIVGMLAIAMM
ncbi:hypothetical protein E4U55_007715 [Claviceps digitariae]|nr:hypothetical protein E4U55_007715 [Claviceps digitariae]